MDELDREIAEQLRRIIQRAEERERLAEAYFCPTSVRFCEGLFTLIERQGAKAKNLNFGRCSAPRAR